MRLRARYLSFTPFTADEAWLLFKLAAWGETAGWTLLIGGIILQKIIHNSIPVLIAGQFHGLLFLIYITAAAALSPSLKWRPRRTVAAGLCSVPPYGSLVFELWAASDKRRRHSEFIQYSIFYRQLLQAD